MAAFCRYWRMTPSEYYELSFMEFDAMVRFMAREAKEMKRAEKGRARP